VAGRGEWGSERPSLSRSGGAGCGEAWLRKLEECRRLGRAAGHAEHRTEQVVQIAKLAALRRRGLRALRSLRRRRVPTESCASAVCCASSTAGNEQHAAEAGQPCARFYIDSPTMPILSALLLSIAAFFSTLAGGPCSRYALPAYLSFILAFTAGVLLGRGGVRHHPRGVQPRAEATPIDPTGGGWFALVLGFLLFHGPGRNSCCCTRSHEADYASHHHPQVGVLSAPCPRRTQLHGRLVGIGLAFQGFRMRAGVSVALAVIAPRLFCDGPQHRQPDAGPSQHGAALAGDACCSTP